MRGFLNLFGILRFRELKTTARENEVISDWESHMPQINPVTAILEGVNRKMMIDFEELTAQISHRASKGRARERVLAKEFLEKYTPSVVQVIESSEIVTSAGESSPECDVLLIDPHSPVWLDTGNYRIVPIETVYAVVEVKSMLDTRELHEAHRKLRTIKSFEKAAITPDPLSQWEIHGRITRVFPVIGIIFAYDSIDLFTLREELDHLQKDDPDWLKIDSVWVLKKGALVYVSGQGIEPAPTLNARLLCIESSNILLMFTMQLSILFQRVRTPIFRLEEYLGDAPMGTILG
jgi:hypothetical protein